MVNNGSMSANASFAAADELQAFANQTCAVSFCWNYANYTQYAAQTQFTPSPWHSPLTTASPSWRWLAPMASACSTTRTRPRLRLPRSLCSLSATTRLSESRR
ncbi:hypothetical protein M5E87_24125 [Flavonifractor plautii]|nr:hypothetical protein M5E87_24125 [Flavonifractor plautii]